MKACVPRLCAPANYFVDIRVCMYISDSVLAIMCTSLIFRDTAKKS